MPNHLAELQEYIRSIEKPGEVRITENTGSCDKYGWHAKIGLQIYATRGRLAKEVTIDVSGKNQELLKQAAMLELGKYVS